MARTTSFTFYQNVNLNMRTNDTFYFADRSAQTTYFNSKVITTKNNLYYQRSHKGRVRVEIAYSTLYKCDYLSFINPDFENKRFYAFVTGVNYIDNNTTEVNYVIDEVQTWLLDCTFARCFVERMHTIRDDYGACLLDDSLDCGLYQTASIQEGLTTDTLVVIVSTFDLYHWAVGDNTHAPFTDKVAPTLSVKQGVYDELCLTAVYSNAAGYNALTGSALSVLLNHIYNGDGGVTMQDIVNIYIYPKIALALTDSAVIGSGSSSALLDNIYRVAGAYFSTVGQDTVAGQDITLPAVPSTIAGFTPNNKKLLQYPFTVMHISNNDGSAIDLRFERFTDPDHPHAQVTGTSCGEAKIRLTPKSYLGVTGNNLDFDTAIDSAPFPTVSMVGDAYLIYLAQNKNRLDNSYNQMIYAAAGNIGSAAASDMQKVAQMYAAGAAGGAAGGAGAEGMEGMNSFGSMASGKATGAQTLSAGVSSAVSTYANVQSIAAQLKDMTVAPATASGISGAGLAFQNGKKDFTISVKQVDYDHAKMIDDYYTMFGYPVRKIPALNLSNYLHARPSFNYIKTVGCIVRGNIPESAKATIEGLFDAGIRFWLDRDHIGDFTVNNDPVISNNP